jgi:competence protein ComEC
MKTLLWLLGMVVIANMGIWFAVCRESRDGMLTVTMLDIGQGDAIYIEAPNGNQVLVDSGPPKTVMRELGKVMPFYDRTIDMMILTNPDTDHMAGFIDVLKRYEVLAAVESGTISDTDVYKELSQRMEDEELTKHIARRGMVVVIDEAHGVYLQILFPDRDVSALNRNDGSIIMKLIYGETSYMLTGDTTIKMERYLVSLKDDLKSNVLKVGHHGSKTSSSEEFVKAVDPELALISAGKGNSYGHPHKDVVGLFDQLGIEYFVTANVGRIQTKSNGNTVRVVR